MGRRSQNSAHALVRVIVMGALVAGCARIAGLGEGDLLPSSSDEPPPGSVTDPDVEITPTSLDFKESACGTATPAQIVTVTNKSDAPIDYAVQAPGGTGFRVDGAPAGPIPAKKSITFSVVATPVLAGENAASIVVTARGGAAIQPIAAKVVGNGPTMELAPPVVAFGDVRMQTGGAPVEVGVVNKGNLALAVASFASSNPSVFDAAGLPLNVAPGATGKFTVSLAVSGTEDPAPVTATIEPKVPGLCGTAPVLQATGRRVNSDIVVSAADWGPKNCGDTPDAQDIVITNYSGFPVSFSITDTPPPSFDTVIVDPSPVPAAPSASAPTTRAIRVTPKKLPVTAPLPNITEQLMVSLTSNGKTEKRAATLHVETRGSLLVYDPVALAFTANGEKPFTFSNPGTDAITFTFGIQRSGGNGPWSVSPSTLIPFFYTELKGGQTQNGKVGFNASAGANDKAGVYPAIITKSGKQCVPFPALPLTGTR